jgi:hypothetical protein
LQECGTISTPTTYGCPRTASRSRSSDCYRPGQIAVFADTAGNLIQLYQRL